MLVLPNPKGRNRFKARARCLVVLTVLYIYRPASQYAIDDIEQCNYPRISHSIMNTASILLSGNETAFA